jgi:hypothetical protein
MPPEPELTREGTGGLPEVDYWRRVAQQAHARRTRAEGTRVPGTQITAAFITPDCRANRGQAAAWDEAVARLRVQYDDILAAWEGQPQQPTLNLVLMMERPDAP